jgi:hypothetical protein
VEFDPTTYAAWQEGARFTPWWAGLDRRVVVFDTPYVDLRRASNTRGIVGWGAHDPGIATGACPPGLLLEFQRRFGPYPASRWTYGVPWSSAVNTRVMGEALAGALDVRARAARWLATERLSHWDFFAVVAGEAHGAVEGLWHGLDASHPLHEHPSGAPAGRALTEIHRALDRLVGEIVTAAPDAAIVAFNMGGMGTNSSDLPSMVLLPELLYRSAFGHPLLTLPSAWVEAPRRIPMLDEGQDWSDVSRSWLPTPSDPEELTFLETLRSRARRLPEPIKGVLRAGRRAIGRWRSRGTRTARQGLYWQPAMRYQRHWSRMPAFALPSFYDGRIRINLQGRERHGLIAVSRYEETCRELETLLRECRDPRTGEPVVHSIERAWTQDPLGLTGSEADLLVVWKGVVAAFEHPRLGMIGPVPFRRTGGHTGPHGMAYVAAPGVDPGDRGIRSAFDVVPTIARLLEVQPAHVSGESLL